VGGEYIDGKILCKNGFDGKVWSAPVRLVNNGPVPSPPLTCTLSFSDTVLWYPSSALDTTPIPASGEIQVFFYFINEGFSDRHTITFRRPAQISLKCNS
jgi:hypothetical protein